MVNDNIDLEIKNNIKTCLNSIGITEKTEYYNFEFDNLLNTVDRSKFLLELVNYFERIDLKGKSVLDAACGPGGLAILASKAGAKVTAVDIDSTRINIAKQIADKEKTKINFFKEDLNNRIFDKGEFDIIFSINTLEHINPRKLIKNLFYYLKPGGKIILKTPNKFFPFETHTRAFFIQFMPVKLVDFYLRRKYKSFFSYYNSFSEIKLLNYLNLKRNLDSLPKYGRRYSIYPVFHPFFPKINNFQLDYKFLKIFKFLQKFKIVNKILTSKKVNLIAQSWIIIVEKRE